MGYRQAAVFPTAALVLLTGACAHLVPGARARELRTQVRSSDIERAQVWQEVDVAKVDIEAGPPGGFPPNDTVTCEYIDKKLGGGTPKFACVLPEGEEVKVKYGKDNGEVFGEVAASRLFWALGFGADRMYPVRVLCHGCPAKNELNTEVIGDNLAFDAAAIERKLPGREIDGPDGPGWNWIELESVQPEQGGAPRAHRDALKLLAVMIQHTDSKAEQQRLLCLGEKKDKAESKSASSVEPCAHPFMMVNDLGNTFGTANEYNRGGLSVNLERWAKTRVWKDGDRCVANLSRSLTGTLENPRISEEGRAFLAGLLVQLSDAQIHALFSVARFPMRTTSSGKQVESIEPWVAAFKDKVEQIVNHTCPSNTRGA